MSLLAITDHDGVWVRALTRPPVNAIDIGMVGEVRGGAEQFAFGHALIRTRSTRSWPRRRASPGR